MLHLSDKELDLLSQEAAKQYDPGMEHSPGSWEKLEKQLTGGLGKTRPSPFRGYRRIPFLYTPIVVLLVGISYFLVKQPPRQNGPANTRSDTASLAGPANSSPPGAVIRTMPSAAPSGTADDKSLKKDPSPKIEIPQNNSTIQNNSTAPEKELNSPSAAAHNKTGPGNDRSAVTHKDRPAPDLHTVKGNTALPGSASPGNASSGNASSVNASPHNRTGGNGRNYHLPLNDPLHHPSRNRNNPADDNLSKDNPADPSDLTNPTGLTGLSHSMIALSPLRHPRPFVDDSALKVLASNIAAKKPPVNPGKKKDRSLLINTPLHIGLLYAPDFTIVKSIEGDKPGHSLGLTLGYEILNRLSINTGLLWTRKNYTALANDFHPPPGSWFNNNNMVQLHYVEGSVDMLEIPLNLRYDFKLADNSIFYLSGGVSSYLAGEENCLYFYENFGMNRRAPEKQNDEEDYWFAAMSLAMGIEKPISNSFSLQVEPYLKLPLSGVGVGNVQLNSFGINFSLRYTPVLGKSRH